MIEFILRMRAIMHNILRWQLPPVFCRTTLVTISWPHWFCMMFFLFIFAFRLKCKQLESHFPLIFKPKYTWTKGSCERKVSWRIVQCPPPFPPPPCSDYPHYVYSQYWIYSFQRQQLIITEYWNLISYLNFSCNKKCCCSNQLESLLGNVVFDWQISIYKVYR